MSTIKKVGLVSLIIAFTFAFVPAFAQESLPKGGSSFDEAVELEPGSYDEGTMQDDDVEYFLLKDVKPGQQLHIMETHENADQLEYIGMKMSLYNQDRTELGSGGAESGSERVHLYWMPGTTQESDDYYLKLEIDKLWGDADMLEFSLDAEVEDYFDAGKGRDAGDTYEEAMEVEPGTYSGYLAGVGPESADRYDTYKLMLDSNEKLDVEVTPPTEGVSQIEILNEERRSVEKVYGSNPGAITKASYASEQGGTYYAKVLMDNRGEENILEYDVSFSKEEVEPEETEETSTSEEESLEDIKEEIPEEYHDQIPEDLEGKSAEEIEEEIKQNLPQGVVENIFGEEDSGKGIIRTIMGAIFGFLIKALMWFIGIIIIIGIVIYLIRKGGSDSEDESEDEFEDEPGDESEDKGPNKPNN